MKCRPAILAAIILSLLAAGCSKPEPGPAPTAAPAEQQAAASAPAESAAPAAAPTAKVTVTGWLTSPVSYRLPDVPLTADVPTFPRDPNSRMPWFTVRTGGPRGSVSTLEALAAQIDQTGNPEPSDSKSAIYVGKLEGDRYIYDLGGQPRPDTPVPDHAGAWELYKAAGGWTATPICQGAPSGWVWPGTKQMQQNPVVICGGNEGSGSVLTVVVYQGDRSVFYIGGVGEGGLKVAEPKNGNPPDLIITGKSQWMDHKLDPWVTERYTFTWKNGGYTLVSMERMADSYYRLNRFLALVAAGDLARAAAEMSPAPAGGLQSYLKEHAPDLPTATAGGKWTTDGYFKGETLGGYIHRKGTDAPWFHFVFTSDGFIASVAEEAPAAQ